MKYIMRNNEVGSWYRLFCYATCCLRLPSKRNFSHSLASLIKNQVMEEASPYRPSNLTSSSMKD